MAVASLVLGIVALVVSFIPCIGLIAIVPALVGLILGIVALVQAKKKQQPKGMATAGIILSILAIIWPLIFVLVLAGGAAATGAAGGFGTP